MRRTEKILVVFIALGIVLQLLHISGGSIFIVLGASALAIFYYLGAIVLLNDLTLADLGKGGLRSRSGKEHALSITAGIALAHMAVGFLFVWQLWSGGAFMALVGLLSGAIVSLLAYFLLRTDHPALLRRIMVRIAPAFAVLAFVGFLPTRTRVAWKSQTERETELRMRMIEHPEDTLAREAWQQYMDSLYRADDAH